MTKKTLDERPKTLFISHRHEDRRIADIFRTAFQGWSNGEVTIFQSSNARTAPGVGDELDDVIRKAAADAGVLLLIYTITDDNWTWCMYECGLAQDPETLDTRLLVFHTPAEPPAPLQHLITLPMSLEAIEKLVTQFHRSPNFFPGRDLAIAPTISDEALHQRSNSLYDSLLGEVHDLQERASVRYDQLTLSIPLSDADTLKERYQDASFKETLEEALPLLERNCLVERVKGEPHAHFNCEEIPPGMPFSELVSRWRKESQHGELQWDQEVYREMTRAILNIKEGALSLPFKSADPDSSAWFLPVLHTVKVIPAAANMEIDVTLAKLKPAAALAMINNG